MPFIDDLNKAIADAMRKRDPVRLSALRMLKAALMNREVERGRSIDDGEARQVVGSLIKQRKDSIEQFRKGDREELALKEEAEIKIIEEYLPAAASDGDVLKAIDEAMQESGATSMKEMGKVMAAAKTKLAGKTIDGARVSQLVKERLSGK